MFSWKYTCLFVWAFYISIYNEHTFVPPFFFPLSLLYYYIYYTEKGNTLSRTLPFPPLPFPPPFLPLYTLLLYTLYIENILSRNFSRPFLTLYYTLIIYRMIHTLPAPFLPLYKVSTFYTAHFLTIIVWVKFAGKSFWKLY